MTAETRERLEAELAALNTGLARYVREARGQFRANLGGLGVQALVVATFWGQIPRFWPFYLFAFVFQAAMTVFWYRRWRWLKGVVGR